MYCFNLPVNLQIYHVFYISLLSDHKPRVGEESPEPQPLRLGIDPKVREYKVEAILASRMQTNPPNPHLLHVIQNRIEEINQADLGTRDKSEARALTG